MVKDGECMGEDYGGGDQEDSTEWVGVKNEAGCDHMSMDLL